MNNKTKRQHYVQCKYLEKWADKESRSGKVLVTSKDGKFINEPIGIEKLCVEKYFYDVSTLSDKEILLLNLIIKDLKICGYNICFNSNIKEELKKARDYIEKNFVNEIENINNKNKFIDRIIKGDTTFYQDSSMVILYKNAINAYINALYSKSRFNINDGYVNKIIVEYKNDDKYNFLLWFYYQHFRTKKFKDLLIDTYDSLIKQRKEFENCNLSNVANIHYLILAVVTAHNTDLIDSHITIYICHPNDNFITSDSPVSSIDSCNNKEYIYPISPKCLVKLSLNKGENYVFNADKLTVQKFNRAIEENAYNHVYRKFDTNI